MTAVHLGNAEWGPNESQRLFLKAALLDRGPALEAWREWNRRETVGAMDNPSAALVGLVWRNLRAHGVADHTMPKLKAAYLLQWFKNQTLIKQAAVPLHALREAGIPTLVLKGASLCPLYYRDWGVRGIADVDILVPPERVLGAISALREVGAGPVSASGPGGAERVASQDVEERIELQHSAAFKHAEGWEVDLHWFSVSRTASDAGMWAHAVPLELAGEQTRAPGPTHQLIQVCTHGAPSGQSRFIRWVADAWTVLQAGEVDWELFEREAREGLLTVVLASALDYLRELLDAPIPEDVVRRLEAVPTRRFERIGFRAAAQPPSPVQFMLTRWERYRRMSILRPDGPGRLERPERLVIRAVALEIRRLGASRSLYKLIRHYARRGLGRLAALRSGA